MYRLLALCARAQCTPEHIGLIQEAAAKLSWTGLPSQAEMHGMAPLLYTHLKASDIQLPRPIQRELQGLYIRHQCANQVRTQVLREILQAYNEIGIQVRVLKGAALMHLVYPEPALRPMSDIDLLIAEADAPRAQDTLVAMGFAIPGNHNAMAGHRHLPAAIRQVEGVLVQIEIHHQLFSNYFDSALHYFRHQILKSTKRPRNVNTNLGHTLSEPAPCFDVDGVSAYTLSYETMLWHLCKHLRSHINIWDFGRLIWVADIVSFAEHFAQEIDWDKIRRSYPSVLETLSLAHTMTPLSKMLLAQAPIKIGRDPQGIGAVYQGWPHPPEKGLQERGPWQQLQATFFPSEWWLRMRYQRGPARPIFWCRWVRHPLYIAAHGVRILLEKMGWPTFSKMIAAPSSHTSTNQD